MLTVYSLPTGVRNIWGMRLEPSFVVGLTSEFVKLYQWNNANLKDPASKLAEG